MIAAGLERDPTKCPICGKPCRKRRDGGFAMTCSVAHDSENRRRKLSNRGFRNAVKAGQRDFVTYVCVECDMVRKSDAGKMIDCPKCGELMEAT